MVPRCGGGRIDAAAKETLWANYFTEAPRPLTRSERQYSDAASVHDAVVARLLLAKGADIHAKASIGQSATALMGAAYNGNVELMRPLLARHAEPDVVSGDRSGTVKNGPVRSVT